MKRPRAAVLRDERNHREVNMANGRPALSDERIAYLEALVAAAQQASIAFNALSQADVDRIVERMAVAGMEQAQQLGRLAYEETKVGVPEDKAVKNMVATEFVHNYV